MEKRLKITFDDPNKEDNKKFANLVDPVLFTTFIERLQNSEETRTLEELFDALLDGTI